MTSDWRLDDETLVFLDRQLNDGMSTVETGAGVSTVLFASKGVKHTCVVPDRELVERIQAYCDRICVPHAQVHFIVGPSEYALPSLRSNIFELALIDGWHGFPAPIIDGFYMADLLKIGGVLIVDDLQIWTCELLAEFLLSEEDWTCVERMRRATRSST